MDPIIAVTFDGQDRIELVQGEDRTIQLAFRDAAQNVPINLTGGTVTMRLPSQGDTPILRSSGPATIQPTQINVSTDTITVMSHGLVTGDPVTCGTTGVLPAPLATMTTYLVKVIDQDNFQLTDSGGNLINLTH